MSLSPTERPNQRQISTGNCFREITLFFIELHGFLGSYCISDWLKGFLKAPTGRSTVLLVGGTLTYMIKWESILFLMRRQNVRSGLVSNSSISLLLIDSTSFSFRQNTGFIPCQRTEDCNAAIRKLLFCSLLSTRRKHSDGYPVVSGILDAKLLQKLNSPPALLFALHSLVAIIDAT